MRTMQKRIVTGHRAWLKKHGGVRPKNPKSTHSALSVTRVEPFENHWDEIDQTVR
jgi:hypothetical protein